VQGVQAHSRTFWLGENPGKILAKTVEIWTKCVKTFAKSLEIRGKTTLDVLCFEKNGAQNHGKTFFCGVIFCIFFEEIWEKILRPIKNLFALVLSFCCSTLFISCDPVLLRSGNYTHTHTHMPYSIFCCWNVWFASFVASNAEFKSEKNRRCRC